MLPENSEPKGFEKWVLSSISYAMKYKLFWEDPTEILKLLVRNTPSSKLLLEPFQSSVYTTSTNSLKGLKGIPAAQSIIKNKSDRTISWKFKRRDKVESVIGCLKIFCNKCHTLMSDLSLVCHHFYITMLKIHWKDTWKSFTIQTDCFCICSNPIWSQKLFFASIIQQKSRAYGKETALCQE